VDGTAVQNQVLSFLFLQSGCNVAVFVMNVIKGKVHPITCEGQEGE